MNKVLIVGGPTGIGKSEVAVRLAQRYNATIVGADSMQIYRGMNIGTGKISEREKCGIPHAMIDIISPNTQYSVQNYVQDAQKAIGAAHRQRQLPIVVGGTGLYINALIHEQNFATAEPNVLMREKYMTIFREHGAEYLHDLLQKIDPQSAENIAVNDVKRVIRALEIYDQTGKAKSTAVASRQSTYDIRFYVLQTERERLYDRIDRRVDAMLQNGWIQEVLELRPFWGCRSMEAIGYREIIAALQADRDPYEMRETIQRNTRRYAKRQITFFKWIQADKKAYVNEDFFQNITATADKWVEEGNL